MIDLLPWTQRAFQFDQPPGVFPAILERLRGTSARASEIVAGVPEDVLGDRTKAKWSAKEHLGHLVDLEVLDQMRLHEFLSGAAVLSPADITNHATENAGHPHTPIQEILLRMRTGRNGLVSKLECLAEEEVAIAAVHPRLRKPLRLLDWVCFVAEHDDHHLASARRAIRERIERQE